MIDPLKYVSSRFSILSMQLLSITSPQKYREDLLNVHNQGIFSVYLTRGIPHDDLLSRLRTQQFAKPGFSLHLAVNILQWTCVLGALLVVHHYAGSRLQSLRVALDKHRGWLAVFWASVNVCLVSNSYTILKIIASTCMKSKAQDCSYGVIAVVASIVLSGIPVIIHFRNFRHYLPPPRMWQLCFPRSCFMLARPYFLLSSWIICFSLIVTPGVHIPYAIRLLSTSYLLYATALAAIYLLLPAAICFTAVIYTIDQMFCVNAEFRLTRRQGLQQVYRLLMATVAFTGAASFAASLHLLLLYSKNGQKTQSISSTVFAVFSTAFTIVAPWAIRTAVRRCNRSWPVSGRPYMKNQLHYSQCREDVNDRKSEDIIRTIVSRKKH